MITRGVLFKVIKTSGSQNYLITKMIVLILFSFCSGIAIGVDLSEIAIQKHGILVETVNSHMWYRERNGILHPSSCFAQGKMSKLSGLNASELEAVKVCVDDSADDMIECFEDPPCISGLQNVINAFSNDQLTIIVYPCEHRLFTAVVKNISSNLYFLAHSFSVSTLYKNFIVASCQPFEDMVLLDASVLQPIYAVGIQDFFGLNKRITCKQLTVLGRKQGYQWDEVVMDHYNIVLSHKQFLSEVEKTKQSWFRRAYNYVLSIFM